ncbi:MAG: L,D-transpeptidase family protein [Candidatus Moraniibacteriota bacterium]
METNPKLTKLIKNWLLVPAFILLVLSGLAVGYYGVLPFFMDPKIEIAKKVLELEDPLTIKFSKSVIHHKIESTFSLTPSMVGNISWEGNDLIFHPIQPWKPGGDYEVKLSGLTDFANQFAFTDYFFTENLPQVQKFNPSEGTLVGPFSPIEFYLDKGSVNYQMNFKVAPDFNYSLSIDPDRKLFQVNPEEPLRPDTQYQVIAYESYQSKNNKNWFGREVANFQFKTIAPPEVQKVIPQNEEENVTEFTPLKAYFNKPMRAEEWQNFVEITPKIAGKAEWLEDGKVFVFKPYRWEENTDYAVKIKGGWRAMDETYLDKDFLTSFHSYDSSGLVKKQSSAASAEAKIKEGKYVDINLSKQILSIFNDGKNMGNYRVSTGKRGMATPTGMFNIKKKSRRAWSKRYGLFMPYWMQFTNQGHGIHELPEWPSGYKEGANHLGIPVSHGCVRLGVGPAATVYGFVEVGTPVYIHY